MKKSMFVLLFALLTAPSSVSAQPSGGAFAGPADEQATTTAAGQPKPMAIPPPKPDEGQPNPRFVRTLTNVQVELTLTDQLGTQAPEKKTVSMIVSTGNWGKIRSVGNVRPQNDAPFVVDLNVDARPFVSTEGLIQLELTLVYSPPGGADKDTLKPRPTGINQSLTVVLQSGKPLVISQAADPVSDRKVIVEVKATVLK
jgi:hypothetical protein